MLRCQFATHSFGSSLGRFDLPPLNAALAAPETSRVALNGSRALSLTSAGYVRPPRDLGSGCIRCRIAARSRAYSPSNVSQPLLCKLRYLLQRFFPTVDPPLPLLQSLCTLSLRSASWTSARKSLVWKRCPLALSCRCKVVWMRCESEGPVSFSADTLLKGRGSLHLLGQSLLFLFDPVLPPSLYCPLLYRSGDPSHLL